MERGMYSAVTGKNKLIGDIINLFPIWYGPMYLGLNLREP